MTQKSRLRKSEPEIATTTLTLADALEAAGHLADADGHREAIYLQQHVYWRNDNPARAPALRAMATTLVRRDQIAAALALLAEAIVLQCQSHEPDHHTVMKTAVLLDHLLTASEAGHQRQRAFDRDLRTVASTTTQPARCVASAYFALAQVARLTQRQDQARALIQAYLDDLPDWDSMRIFGYRLLAETSTDHTNGITDYAEVIRWTRVALQQARGIHRFAAYELAKTLISCLNMSKDGQAEAEELTREYFPNRLAQRRYRDAM